ncbi:MAG: hypothetical protein H0V17_25335 [Deltaproteobacteria bacterium]|nr:hypothetical protein [Deltaproteobacteria bacterium]
MRLIVVVTAVLAAQAGQVRADVFDVCKGESKRIVAGTGKLSIALVLPDDFPGRTTREVLFPIGVRLATAEKAKVILVSDVDRAVKLVGAKRWDEKSDMCGTAPTLNAVLGQKHPNLSTAHVSMVCPKTAPTACELIVDLERHGAASAERWIRYTAPVTDAKSTKAIAAAGAKLAAKGVPPDAPASGLMIDKLTIGKIRVRSDVDGALEADRIMEATPAIAACSIPNRKSHDVRGYWAEWMLSAKGTVYQALVKPFAGRDPKDDAAAECIKKALETTQLPCPRDAKTIKVKTAICL